MGEPRPQSHERHFDFPFWPVKSASELADYAEWLIDLVRHESSVEPAVKLDIKLVGRDRESPISLAEFRERFDEFPFDKVFAVSLDAWKPDETLTLEFRMTTGMVSAKAATVTVTGTDKETVQRIKAKVREEGEARIARVREAASKAGAELGEVVGGIFRAEAKREQDRATRRKKPSTAPERPSPAPVSKPDQSQFKRFIYNPWTIGLGVTVVGTVIAALILAAILSP